jgi:hypothetical protein
MNGPPSREEIDAKLESIRMSSEAFFARMDARGTRMEAAFESRCTRMEAAFESRCARMEAAFEARCQGIEKAMTARMDAMAAALIELMDRRFADMDARFAALEAKLASLYKAMIITAITSTLTIILGVGAVNATVFTGMLAALDTGKDAGAMMTRLEKRMQEQDAQFNRAMLKQTEEFARMRAELDERLERERAERQSPPARQSR